MSEEQKEIDRLKAEIARLERQAARYAALTRAAGELLKWAEFGGAGYSIGRKPVDDLRKAWERCK